MSSSSIWQKDTRDIYIPDVTTHCKFSFDCESWFAYMDSNSNIPYENFRKSYWDTKNKIT